MDATSDNPDVAPEDYSVHNISTDSVSDVTSCAAFQDLSENLIYLPSTSNFDTSTPLSRSCRIIKVNCIFFFFKSRLFDVMFRFCLSKVIL